MSALPEFGKVKVFFHESKPPHGFLRLTSGASLQMRWADYRLPRLHNAREAEFCLGARPHPSRRVQQGEAICFERETQGQNTGRIRSWCFKEHYDAAVRELAERVPEEAVEHLRLTGQFLLLLRRIDIFQIGPTGHVIKDRAQVAVKRGVQPPTDWEVKLLGPYIEQEKARRQNAFRSAMIEVLGEDPFADDGF